MGALRWKLIRGASAVLILAWAVMNCAPVVPAQASTWVPRRVIALRWAERQAGKWYCWAGAGPSCFDCSGLVMAAYAHAGISLPHSTYSMLASARLVRVPAADRKRGDLAFYGSGHVELVTAAGTFGALEPGTRIGWHHPSGWWHPTAFYRVRI